MENNKQKNVLGENLEECSNEPLTGWFRDGCCNTDKNDHGVHTVCAKVTTEFLEWLKEEGNDLITCFHILDHHYLLVSPKLYFGKVLLYHKFYNGYNSEN